MLLTTLFNTLLALFGGHDTQERYPKDYGPHLKSGDEFDFIVVGAGSAGSVVASRLSESGHWKILLIEAGGYPSELSEIPAASFGLQGTEEDWQLKTEPSATCCLGLKNGVCNCATGKGLGGSSLINYNIYTRTTRYDHERWVNCGNKGWDHDTVEKYYKKIENVHIEYNKYYGESGNVHLTRYTSTQPLRHILMTAYKELGHSEYIEGNPIGFKDVLLSVYQGTRQSAAKSYLTPAKDRKNLFVALNAQVSKLLIDRNELSVRGVELKIRDQVLNVKAKKEAILSAGSLNSPRILMNSGIGPKEHLSKVGIEVIRDLKVGDNYQDHIAFPLLAVGIDHLAVIPISSLQIASELYEYFRHKQGMLTEIGITNFYHYINTRSNSNFANAQLVHILIQKGDTNMLEETLSYGGMPESARKSVIEYVKNSPLIIFYAILLHPKSRGKIRLQNADPFSAPLIFPNYLSDENEEDVEDLLAIIKYVKTVIATRAFATYDPKIIHLDIPNCREFESQSDDFWKCAIRNIGMNALHPVGTCKMGSDSSAVVDSKLRVRGVKGLRVIDASVIPLAPSCNTNGPALMIGERGADLIIESWRNKHDEL